MLNAPTVKITAVVATVVVVVSLQIPNSCASVYRPPGLGPGDTYHLAFLTQARHDAQHDDIEFYNQFVSEQAALNPSLTGTDMGVTWKVIGSTESVDARDNAEVGYSVPVYTLTGVLIAENRGDMWDGELASPLNVDQFGVSYDQATFVWTGTGLDGTTMIAPLGNSEPIYGRAQDAGHWISAGRWSATREYQFYALSSSITIPLIPGDANLDGYVDGTDYLLWAENYGDNPADDPPGPPLNGDFNEDEIVDGLDYLIWAANFSPAVSPVAVPEPHTVVLLFVAVVTASICRVYS